jgi:hypothetical protein
MISQLFLRFIRRLDEHVVKQFSAQHVLDEIRIETPGTGADGAGTPKEDLARLQRTSAIQEFLDLVGGDPAAPAVQMNTVGVKPPVIVSQSGI